MFDSVRGTRLQYKHTHIHTHTISQLSTNEWHMLAGDKGNIDNHLNMYARTLHISMIHVTTHWKLPFQTPKRMSPKVPLTWETEKRAASVPNTLTRTHRHISMTN